MEKTFRPSPKERLPNRVLPGKAALQPAMVGSMYTVGTAGHMPSADNAHAGHQPGHLKMPQKEGIAASLDQQSRQGTDLGLRTSVSRKFLQAAATSKAGLGFERTQNLWQPRVLDSGCQEGMPVQESVSSDGGLGPFFDWVAEEEQEGLITFCVKR